LAAFRRPVLRSVTDYVKRTSAWQSHIELDAAFNNCREIIRLNPEAVNAYGNRGMAWFDKRDTDSGIKDYSRAIRLDSILALRRP
jgi:tetratricopeptide (TPR) repeat protein